MRANPAVGELRDKAARPLTSTLAVIWHTFMQPSNILKIETLTDGWRDKDSLLLHACFQILKDFVVQENLLSTFNNSKTDERHLEALNEIVELCNWWQSYREPDVPDEKSFKLETQMLTRLINVRWALWV